MNNIAIANETIRITKDGKYSLNGKEIIFPDVDTEDVILISPSDGEDLLADKMTDLKNEKICNISIVNKDSFEAGRQYDEALVMNFANAHNPGGGFKLGANAQEETLCRCSTLYESITSKKASKMYIHNNTHPNMVESDYMLLSPNVVVFRDEKYNLLNEPVLLGVITAPAPNRYGAALLASDKLIEDTFLRRIRITLAAAAKYGYINVVLGAWGCGAFGNSPNKVAEYFRQVIIEEDYGRFFDEICFAIYGSENGKNINAFRECFQK